MRPSTSKRRLMMLVKLLRALPRKRFNYSRWVGDDWRGATDLSCGTVACALGWGTTIPTLRRAGLHLEKYELDNDGHYEGIPVCGIYRDEAAAAEVFGISDDEARTLFFPGLAEEGNSGLLPSATPKQVAAHIERFVKAKFGGAK